MVATTTRVRVVVGGNAWSGQSNHITPSGLDGILVAPARGRVPGTGSHGCWRVGHEHAEMLPGQMFLGQKSPWGDRKTTPPRSLVRESGRNNEMHLLRVLFLGPSVPLDALAVAMRRVSSVQSGTKVFQNFQDRRSKKVHYPGYTGRESGR